MNFIGALQKYVDDKEECVIYPKQGAAFSARIIEIGADYIRFDENDSESVMLIDSVERIRTYPKNEKGKKKTLFA